MDPAARYTELRAETTSTFDKIGHFLADLCEGSGAHNDAAEDSNLDSNLGSFYETFSRLKARHGDQNLTVAVLALTKSGKSTLLNALIGANCLPANNVPETARITRITHTQAQAELVDNTAEETKVVTGEEEIKAYLRYLNTEARTRDHMRSDETYLDLKIPIAALQASNEVTAAAQTVTVRLLDTPGPNEAGEVALRAQVERLLDSVDAVIYLLDYTKLKTADEAEVLQRLKEINPQLIARLSQRLFFVVNKADMIETSEGLDADATKQYVADLITSQMQDESFQLKPDQVLLLSAQQALLSRLVLQGKADKDTHMRFGRLAFGSRARKFSEREHKQAAEEMLTDSGLAELEGRVLGFLYAHSGSLKLLALLDDIVRMLSQIRNVAAASNAALQHDVTSLQRESEELQGKLERSLQSFDAVQQEAQAVEGEVVDEVQQRMQRLKEKLFRDVTLVLEPSRLHPPGRWQEAWHRAARFLNRRPGHTEAHQLELQNKLYELHAAISSSIEAEVRDFWQDVEAATNERQRSLFHSINRRLERLSRDIEATVGQVLDLRLEPVTIAMDPPAAQDFHNSLQTLFSQGIRHRSVTRNRHRQQDYTVWEPHFRNGLCRTGQYFVGRPARRRVAEQYEQSVYDLQPQHIKEYFIALVDGTIEASVKYVREYVHAYLSDMLEDARGQIQAYAQSFNTTMHAALQTRQQGEDASSAALSSISARLTAANSLLHDVAAVQRHAEALCPGEHRISDVMSEYSLDDAESSHAVHAEHDSNLAELSEAEPTRALHAEPAVAGMGKRQSNSSGWVDIMPVPVALATYTAGSAATAPLLRASEAAVFQIPAEASSSRSSANGTVQPQPRVADGEASGLGAEPSAPAAEMLACSLPGVGLAEPTAVESLPPAMGPQESPLPAMMSELQEAMTASVCSAGSSEAAAEGLPIDEQCQLELALFLSLEEKERADRQAAATATAPEAPPPSASAAAASDQFQHVRMRDGPYAHAERACRAATAAAAAAASQAEAAVQQAGDAVTHQVASVHDTVHAVMGQVDAVLRSLPGFTAPVFPPTPADGHSPDSIEQEEAELAQAAEMVAGSGGGGGHGSDESDHEDFEPSGHAIVPNQRLSANFGVSVASPEGGSAASAPAAARAHSFSSDDSSFEFADAPSDEGMPALPTDPFASLNPLAMDVPGPGSPHPPAEAAPSHLDMLDSGIKYVPEEESDSPFFAGNDSSFGEDPQAAAARSGHAHRTEEAVANAVSLPDVPWRNSHHVAMADTTAQLEDNADQHAPFSYPQVDRSNLTYFPSEGSSSPIVYPQVVHPVPNPAGDGLGPTDWEGSESSGPPSPRTQLHNMALGEGLVRVHTPLTLNEAAGNEAVSFSPLDPLAMFRLPRRDAMLTRQQPDEQVEPTVHGNLFGGGPASFQVHEEDEGQLPHNFMAELTGHGELSQEDSSEWEIVSSDADED